MRYEADLVVVGAGLAGVSAALAARRNGLKRVVLLEQAALPGGVAVMAQVHSMLTFHSLKGRRIVGGIAQELVDRLVACGGSPGHVRDTVGVAWSVTPVSTAALAAAVRELLREENVDFRSGTRFLRAQRSGKFIEKVYVSRGGREESLSAPLYLDASGSGVLAASAGCGFDSGRGGSPMPATLIFSVGNADVAAVKSYMLANPGEFHWETPVELIGNSPVLGVSGFFSLWKKAALSIPRDRFLAYQSVNEGEFSVNSTRIVNFNPFDEEAVFSAYDEAMEQIELLYGFLRRFVPGFSRCRITSIAPEIGVREVRRITGLYRLSAQDVLLGRRFGDEVALGGFPVDIHSPSGANLESISLKGEGFYGIPFRSLVAKDAGNLLVAGKCFSADFEAHASARVQATVMAMGEAAGTAAALLGKGKELAETDAAALRRRLQEQGALLEPSGSEEALR